MVIVAGSTYLQYTNFPAEAEVKGPPAYLRLHVLANSDSEADQTLKLAVRDQILVALNTPVRNVQEFNDALAAVEQELPALQERIAVYLAEKNAGTQLRLN